MTRYYFVRHGQTDENKAHHIQGRRDIPLNDFGRYQAKLAGEYIKDLNIKFDKIYSSPLSRAYETACIIKNVLDLDIDVLKRDNFTERYFGVKEGMDVCAEVFVEINNDSAEGLEKSYDIQKRVKDEVFYLTENNNDKNVLVVAHSHTIKALTTAVDSNLYRFDQRLDNCSITIFDCDGKNVNVLDYNIKTQ